MTAPSLRKNYLYTVVVQLVSMLAPLITAPYIARVLGTEGVGVYSYVLSVATAFSLFAALGLSAYGLREVSRVRDNPEAVSRLFWELTRLRFVTTLLTGAVYALLCLLGGEWQVYAAMSLLILATGLDITWFFQAMERFGTLMLRHLAVKVLGVVLVFVLVRDEGDVAVYALIQTGQRCCPTCCYGPICGASCGGEGEIPSSTCVRRLRILSLLLPPRCTPCWIRPCWVSSPATWRKTAITKALIKLCVCCWRCSPR